MEKLTKGDEKLDPKALERAMRPREEAEAALELTKAQKQSDSGRAMSTIQEAINM